MSDGSIMLSKLGSIPFEYNAKSHSKLKNWNYKKITRLQASKEIGFDSFIALLNSISYYYGFLFVKKESIAKNNYTGWKQNNFGALLPMLSPKIIRTLIWLGCYFQKFTDWCLMLIHSYLISARRVNWTKIGKPTSRALNSIILIKISFKKKKFYLMVYGKNFGVFSSIFLSSSAKNNQLSPIPNKYTTESWLSDYSSRTFNVTSYAKMSQISWCKRIKWVTPL